MSTFLLVFAVSFTARAAPGSVADALIGFPLGAPLLNATCQGLLGVASGVEGAQAIAILREHRVRAMNRADVAGAVASNLVVDARARPGALDVAAAHLRGIERWTAAGHGEVFGFVLKGSEAIAQYERRADELREFVTAAFREDEAIDHAQSLARLLVNAGSMVVVGASAVVPEAAHAAVPLLALLDPISANRNVLAFDFTSMAVARRARGLSAPGDWLFAARTYVLRDVVVDAIRTRDVRKVAGALFEHNWAELNFVVSELAHWVRRVRDGAAAAHALRRQTRRSYVLVDRLLRIDEAGQPELVITVRLTKSTPARAFARDAVPSAGAALGIQPSLR